MLELIHGKVFRMSPTPGLAHQRISSNIHRILSNYFFRHQCQVFAAPFDVRLALPPDQQIEGKIDTVVQPDISVICDPAKLDERGCKGAPDWIIEILSPATARKDLRKKFDLYEFAQVQEYWIVYPEGSILIYQRSSSDNYQLLREWPFVQGDIIHPVLFSDLKVDLDEVF